MGNHHEHGWLSCALTTAFGRVVRNPRSVETALCLLHDFEDRRGAQVFDNYVRGFYLDMRRRSETSYYEHNKRVGEGAVILSLRDGIRDTNELYKRYIAGKGHDIIEDIAGRVDNILESVDCEALVRERLNAMVVTGVPAGTHEVISNLSRDPGESYFSSYINRIARQPIERVVKSSDICHNTEPDEEEKAEPRARSRYAIALPFLTAIRHNLTGHTTIENFLRSDLGRHLLIPDNVDAIENGFAQPKPLLALVNADNTHHRNTGATAALYQIIAEDKKAIHDLWTAKKLMEKAVAANQNLQQDRYMPTPRRQAS